MTSSAEITSGRENGHRRPKGYAEWRPQRRTRVLLEQVGAVLAEYEEQLPLTVRQVFYRLVGAHGYPKDERAYARLCEALVRARRAGLVDFGVLRDDGVTVMSTAAYGEREDFWDHVGAQIRGYRRDKQAGQHVYVELWCEAAGMMPQLHRVADEYSVPVYSCGGFSSLSAVRHIVDRVVKRNVPTVLLHVGDLDPSGASIYDAMTEDAMAFLERDALLRGVHRLEPVRVALTPAQVVDHGLPTAPAKASDGRSRNWQGGTCQVEALPPDVLAEIVGEAILCRLDEELVAEHVAAEDRDRSALFRELPRGAE